MDEQTVLVESRSAPLVAKLCALLGRAEIRDLVDVEALLGSGEDLGEGLARAPERDGGFSVLTLAWLLKELDVPMLAREAGMGESEAARLDAFRVQLIDRLLTGAVPRGE